MTLHPTSVHRDRGGLTTHSNLAERHEEYPVRTLISLQLITLLSAKLKSNPLKEIAIQIKGTIEIIPEHKISGHLWSRSHC